ncbi:MAG: hypothetical protein E2O56_04240 [Gammaproteobacteria bacterium]|nr:MAG: hypothetical protein E2O56_04240 [Gammaproteobacteria bacterium]
MVRCAAFVFLLLFLTFAGCSKPPDEARIHAAIDAMVEAVEQKRPGDFMEHVATDFSGPAEVSGRIDVERLLRYHQIRNRNIGVVVRSVKIQVRDDRATASFHALLTGSQSWLPERGKDYVMVSGWRLDDGEWKLINARWQ